MSEEATRITAEIVDGNRISVYFKWNPRVYAHGVQASIVDGEVHLWLHLEDAREFHRKLGEALTHAFDYNIDIADAGHRDPEEAAAEADYKGDPAREPSDARSGA